MSQPFLTLVIPAYNKEQQIQTTLETVAAYLGKQEYSASVLVVDDGSSDETRRVVRSYVEQGNAPPDVRLIETDHRGRGYAVRTGMLNATAKYILFTDADLATPISETGKMIGSLEAGHDLAIGTREGIGAARANEPYLRHLAGRAFNLIVRLSTGLGFRDTQLGFKGFRREVAHDLFDRVRLYGEDAKPLKGRAITGFDVEVLYLAVQAGYRIEEIPVRWNYRAGRRPTILVDAPRMLSDVLKVRRMARHGVYDHEQSEQMVDP
jgi:glycosyltransferase involved in cell wall biosynthesis